MKIAIGSDHAGFLLKETVLKYLNASAHQVIDVGTKDLTSVDYPDFAETVAQKVISNDVDLGILICYTGIGMSITANKINGVRAALVTDVDSSRLSRQHNDANILCLGSRKLEPEDAKNIVEVFLTTTFEGERHLKRVKKIAHVEVKNHG